VIVVEPVSDVDRFLSDLSRETAEHHDPYEKTHPKHNWWDWYAVYINTRQHGRTPEEASQAAALYMEGVFGALSR